MAVSIDERVVEMRFNNKQFEEGVKQSMKSLTELDSTIDHLDNKNLNTLVNKLNAINFDAIEQSVGSLEKRFSAFGVAGMTVVQDLVHGVESLAGKMASLFAKPFAQIKSGGWARAMNIENAKFQLKGLKVAWDDISKDISYGVQDTAYGLDAAAKAASQLVASGVQFGETFGETGNSPMAKALRGISGVAAMSNSAYEEISPIFTTIAGQGKVMTMQLRQLESRGLNAAAELGKYLGKTETEVREMVTNGKIDFETFSTAMDEAFGQHAKDANETFSGSLSNMKAALSRIGADIGSNVLEKMVGVFNELRMAINELHVKFQPFIDEINRWVDIATAAIQKTVAWARNSKDFDKKMTVLRQTLIQVTDSLAVFVISIIKYSAPLRENLQAISDIVWTVIGYLMGFKGKISPIQAIIKILQASLKTILIVLTGLTYAIRKILETLMASNIGELISKYLLPLAKIILPLIIGYLILTRFRLLKVAAVVAAIGAAIYAFQKFKIIEKLKTVWSIISGIASTISTKLADAFTIVSDFVSGLADSGKSGLDAVKDFFTNLHDTLFGENGSITDGLAKAGDKLKIFGAGIKGFFTGVIGPGTLLMYGLAAAVIYTIVTISNAMKAFSKLANNFAPFAWLNSIAKGVKGFLEDMGQAEKLKAAAQIIATMAASMIALAAAAAILTNVVDPEAFQHIGIGIGAMAAGLGVLLGVLAQFGRSIAQTGLEAMSLDIGKTISKSIQQLARTLSLSILIRAFASSVLLVAAAIIALAVASKEYNISGAATHIEILLGLMMAFSAVMAIVSSKIRNPEKVAALLISISAGMAVMAGSLFIMGKAIEQFSQLSLLNSSLTDVLKVVLSMVSSAIVLGAGLVVMSKLLKGASLDILSFVVACAGLIAVLYVLPNVINSLARMLSEVDASVSLVLRQYKDTLPLIIAEIGVITLGIMSISGEVNHVIRSLVLMIGTMGAIMLMLEYIARITPNKLYAIVENITYLSIPIGLIAGLIAVILHASQWAGNALKAAAMLLSVPLTILGMVVALKAVEVACRGITIDSIEAIFVGLMGIAGSIYAIAKMASGFEGSAKALLALSVTILALTVAIGAMTLLAREDPWSLLVGAGAAALAMLAFAELLSKLSKYVSEMKPMPIMAMLVGIMGIVWQLGETMKAILNSGGSYGEILSATLGVTAIVLAITNMMMSFSSIYQYIRKMNLKDVGKIAGIMASIMGVLFTFGQSIAAIVKSGASTSSIIWFSIFALGMIAVVSSCVESIVDLVSKSNLDMAKVAAIAATIVGLSSAIAAMGLGLSLIASSVSKDNWAALSSVAVGAIAIGALLVVIANIAKNLTDIESMDWTAFGQQLLLIVAFTGDLFLIGFAVKQLVDSGIDFNKGLGVLISMGALLAEIGALMVIFGAIGKNGSSAGGMLAGAAALTIASVGIIAMAQGLSMLMKVDYDPSKLQSVTTALIELTAVIGVFVAAVGALSQAPITLIGVAVAGGVLAGVCIGIGWAIKLATEGMATLVTAIAILVTAMTEGATLSGQAMDEFVASVEDGMDELIRYIDTRAEDLGAALGKMYTSFKKNSRSWTGNLLSDTFGWVDTGGKNISNAINNAFFGGSYSYDDSYMLGKYQTDGFAKGVNDNVGVVEDSGENLANKFDESVRKPLKTNSPGKEMWEIGYWQTIGFEKGIYDNLEVVEVSGKKVGEEFLKGQKAVLEKKEQNKIAKKAAKDAAKSMTSAIKKTSKDTAKSYAEAYLKQGDLMGAALSAWDEIVVHGFENAGNAITGNWAQVTSATEEYVDDQKKNTKEYVKQQEAIQKTTAATQKAVTDSTQNTSDVVADAVQEGVNGVQTIAQAGVDTLEDIGVPVPEVVENAVDAIDATKTVGDLFTDIYDVVTGKKDLMEVAGEYAGGGLWDGFLKSFADEAGLGELNDQLDSLWEQFIFDEEKALAQADKAVMKRFEMEERFRMEVEAEAKATGKSIKETEAWAKAVENSVNAQRTNWESKRGIYGATHWLDEFLNGVDEAAKGLTEFDFTTDLTTEGLGDLSGKLRSATSMFGEFDRTVTLTSKDMLKNLKNNLLATSEWEIGIESLRKKGLDSRMITEFIASGVDGSYQQVAALSKASKKEIKAINKIFSRLKKKDIRIADAFDDKGNLKKSYLKYLDGLKIPKDFDMGLKDWSKVTGKKLNQAFRKAFNKIDMNDLSKGSKVLSKALNEYVDASTSKSEKATEAFKKYLRESYLASLDEAEKQDFLAKKKKQQEKDITKWYKQMSKERKEAIAAEIRAQDSLSKQRTKTGDEYVKELKQRNKDAKANKANKEVLAAAFRRAGYKDAANEIINELDESSVLALLEEWFEAGGVEAGKSFYEGMAKDLTGNRTYLKDMEKAFEAAYISGDKQALDDFMNTYYNDMSKLKSAAEVYVDTLTGIEKGVGDAISKNKKLTKSIQNISKAFMFTGVANTIEAASTAVQNYALSLLDLDEIEQEAAETGVDSADLIKSHLDDVINSLNDFRNNVESSLKSALQSFEAFDEGEKKSIGDMIKNLQNNVTKLNEFRAAMKRMQTMGYSSEVISYIAEQGMSAYSEAMALTAADVTTSQINEINQTFHQIGDQVKTAADEELGAVAIATGTVGRDTVDGIITGVEEKQLELNETVENTVVSAAMAANDAIQGELLIVKETVSRAVDNLYSTMAKEVDVQQDKLSKAIYGKSKITAQLLNSGYTLKQVNKMWKAAGMESVQGYIDGVTEYNAQKLLKKTGQGLAFNVINTFMNELDINSPSKKFKWMGEMCMEGLAIGFEEGSYTAEDLMLTYAQDLLSDIQSITSDDGEWTIKPVLDLDNLQNANSLIQSLLGNGDIAVRSATLAGQTATQSEWSMLSKALSGVGTTTETNTYGDTQIIVNPPAGSNSREIAQMVMSEIQRQMDRRQRI